MQVPLELALGQSCVAGEVNPGKSAPAAALSTDLLTVSPAAALPAGLFTVFLHRGYYAFSLFFPLTNLLVGEALIGLHF